MSDDKPISRNKLRKFGRSDAERVHYSSAGKEQSTRFQNFADLLNEWQTRLKLDSDGSLFAYSGLDGVLTEKQWKALRSGESLPDDRLAAYFYKAIPKVVNIAEQTYHALRKPMRDIPLSLIHI